MISGVEYINGRVGYFLMNGMNESEWVPIKTIDEFIELGSYNEIDLPMTQEALKEFSGYPSQKQFDAFFIAAVEVVLCCVNNGNIKESFNKLDAFASFIKDANVDETTKQRFSSMIGGCIEDQFYQFYLLIQGNELKKESWDIDTFVNKCNELLEKLGLQERLSI